MKQIREYLTTKVSKSAIKATDETIHQIIKEELDIYGHDCNLNHIDVSEVTSMNNLFSCHENNLGKSYSDLNPDISEWDVSNVRNMSHLFHGCERFNCNISKWDVSNVTSMKYMFYKCTSFNQNLSKWNVSNVTNMNLMFYECKSFNKNLSAWDVSNVKYNGHIFDNCQIEEKYKPKFK